MFSWEYFSRVANVDWIFLRFAIVRRLLPRLLFIAKISSRRVNTAKNIQTRDKRQENLRLSRHDDRFSSFCEWNSPSMRSVRILDSESRIWDIARFEFPCGPYSPTMASPTRDFTVSEGKTFSGDSVSNMAYDRGQWRDWKYFDSNVRSYWLKATENILVNLDGNSPCSSSLHRFLKKTFNAGLGNAFTQIAWDVLEV